jgi:hypothetical protein
MDILKEIMMESIEKKILEFKTEKEIYEYNEYQLQLVLDDLNEGKELSPVQKTYLEIIFDQ